MGDVPGPTSGWMMALVWLAFALLVVIAVWTLIRAPGRKHDPGRRENRGDGPPTD